MINIKKAITLILLVVCSLVYSQAPQKITKKESSAIEKKKLAILTKVFVDSTKVDTIKKSRGEEGFGHPMSVEDVGLKAERITGSDTITLNKCKYTGKVKVQLGINSFGKIILFKVLSYYSDGDTNSTSAQIFDDCFNTEFKKSLDSHLYNRLYSYYGSHSADFRKEIRTYTLLNTIGD